ncbi:hypothetical protein [Streptomyces sp. NBC_00286]|uniref:hypothetical protein n=1 Tax=Streptomyces sp. NBC_00286 TaxID=2975701 RepID=UPI002E2B7CA4|nr:hypothetical protein [Streptomyces sp. NBC_00286]
MALHVRRHLGPGGRHPRIRPDARRSQTQLQLVETVQVLGTQQGRTSVQPDLAAQHHQPHQLRKPGPVRGAMRGTRENVGEVETRPAVRPPAAHLDERQRLGERVEGPPGRPLFRPPARRTQYGTALGDRDRDALPSAHATVPCRSYPTYGPVAVTASAAAVATGSPAAGTRRST